MMHNRIYEKIHKKTHTNAYTPTHAVAQRTDNTDSGGPGETPLENSDAEHRYSLSRTRLSKAPETKIALCFCLLVGAIFAARFAAAGAGGASVRAGLAVSGLGLLASLALLARLLRDSIRQTEAARADEAAQSRIGDLLESLPCAFFALDTAGRLTYANAQAEAFLQHPRADLQGKDLAEILPATLCPAFAGECRRAADTRAAAQFECCDETVERWYDVGVAPIAGGLSVTVNDITPRKRVEEAQARLLAILEATPDLIAINDMRGKICYFNRAGREMLGLPSMDATGRALAGEVGAGLPGIEVSELQDDVFPIGLENGVWQGEMALRTRHGRTVPVSQVVIAHTGPDGKVAYLSTIARDITARKLTDAQMQQSLETIREQKAALEQQQAELIHKSEMLACACAELESANVRLANANLQLEGQATTDGLTGLNNHRAFQSRLTREFDRSERYHSSLSLLFLDVDKFKEYNDTFGHQAGDEVLRRLGQILQGQARTTDMAARYGGEEFVVMLPDTDEAGAVEVAERVRFAIESAGWDKRAVTVSVGVASMRPGMSGASALIEDADQALYVSKEFGRNRVTHFDTLMNSLVRTGGD